MNGIGGVDTLTLSLQLKAFFVFEFLNEYNKLEQAIRKIFEENISYLPAKVLQQLYFYYGGKIGTYIEYEAHTLKLHNMNFKEQERFKELSINQIIKIFKEEPYLEKFNFTIESIQRSNTVFPFCDCVIRLLNMRNKLAHEVVDLQFKSQDLIELLSYDKIANERFPLFQNYDIQKMDNMTLYIASNIVYMRKLLATLNSEMIDS